MEIVTHDVLLVGGGGAGLRAAIAIAEAHPGLSVGVLSKVYPMRSHTVAAEGGAAGAIKAGDSLDAHAYDTISGGDWLPDQDAVEAFCREAPEELLRLEHWGCPWSRESDGHVAVRPFGGMKIERTWFAADKTGFHLLHTLYQTALRHAERSDLRFYDEYFVTRLLVADGRCQGVTAIEIASGRVHALLARAVVLATGGCGKVFPYTTNASIKTGDGMALAYRAGVPLKDMEFVQYHPTGLPFTGILITEAARAEGGWLVNKDGYRYLQDYDLGTPTPEPQLRSMELGPRDRLSQAFVHEMKKGRTVATPYGEVVHLDVRHLGAAKIEAKIPFVRELCLKYENLDPVDELIPVRPVVHYMMGGVDTDLEGATRLPGLYAAGECACVSINGANRLGSNSLTEILVFGARAGRAAAEHARGAGEPGRAVREEALAEEERIAALRAGARSSSSSTADAGERVAGLRAEMQAAMESGAGIYRDEGGLRAAIESLAAVRERAGRLVLEDGSSTFNTELLAALELENLLEVAESMLHSALARRESRGAHQRTDHPARDDAGFLAHSLAFRREGAPPEITREPVRITRWPPGERVYGR